MVKLSGIFKGRRKGFTLVELLVVIALISLMATVGGGMFAGTVERLRLDRAANDLLTTAKYARMIAIERQQRYVLYLDLLENSIFLVTTQINENGSVEEVIVQDSFSKPKTFEQNIAFEYIQITPISSDEVVDEYDDLQKIAFNPDGSSQAAVVQIGNGRMQYTLTINAATGKAKLYPDSHENIEPTTIDLDLET